MVLGTGLMARAFENDFGADELTLIFASGVSHSKETDENGFSRERSMLRNALRENPEKLFVYFSSCSIYDPSMQRSAYVKHKLDMEGIIHASGSSYLIFRVSNVVGFSSNSSTIFNYLVHNVITRTEFDLWKGAVRNIIDVEHVAAIVKYFVREKGVFNQTINVANPYNYAVVDLVGRIEAFFGKKGSFKLVDAGESFEIETTQTRTAADILGIDFSNGYVNNLLEKYYRI